MLMICDSVRKNCPETCQHRLPHTFSAKCHPSWCEEVIYEVGCVPAKLREYSEDQIDKLAGQLNSEIMRRKLHANDM